jgi:hypothetical protein
MIWEKTMAEIRPMSICVVKPTPPQVQTLHNIQFVFFLGPIPNAPGFGLFMTMPHENYYAGVIRQSEPMIRLLTDVEEATTEQLNTIKRFVFNVKPPDPPPPLFSK